MAIAQNLPAITEDQSAQAVGSVDAMLQKNALTTAGLVVGCGTAGFGTFVLATAIPAKFLGGCAVATALLVAGDLQHKGKLELPTLGKKDEQETTEVSEEA